MSLKEFADYIIKNKELHNYDIQHGILSLSNYVDDISYLTVYSENIDISDCYIINSRNIVNE